MDNIELVLDFIANSEKVTQRKISEGTRLSLGNINLILKRCLEKGLIKMEAVNRNNIKYILTPKGLIEKSIFTYKYLQNAFKNVTTLKENLDNILKSNNLSDKKIIFLGTDDEIKISLKGLVSEYEITSALWVEDIDAAYKIDNAVVILWQPEIIQKCWQNNLKYIDLLSLTHADKTK